MVLVPACLPACFLHVLQSEIQRPPRPALASCMQMQASVLLLLHGRWIHAWTWIGDGIDPSFSSLFSRSFIPPALFCYFVLLLAVPEIMTAVCILLRSLALLLAVAAASYRSGSRRESCSVLFCSGARPT